MAGTESHDQERFLVICENIGHPYTGRLRGGEGGNQTLGRKERNAGKERGGGAGIIGNRYRVEELFTMEKRSSLKARSPPEKQPTVFKLLSKR